MQCREAPLADRIDGIHHADMASTSPSLHRLDGSWTGLFQGTPDGVPLDIQRTTPMKPWYIPAFLWAIRNAWHEWQPIEAAPKDGNILVWFNHNADPYRDPHEPHKLTPYALWAESGYFTKGVGICIAKWHPQHFEAEDEYGTGYWMPAAWFAFENEDYERVCNPTHWMPLPTPPEAP